MTEIACGHDTPASERLRAGVDEGGQDAQKEKGGVRPQAWKVGRGAEARAHSSVCLSTGTQRVRPGVVRRMHGGQPTGRQKKR